MEDLFKQFRDNLERRPEPAFEERDWQDMQTRLDRDAQKRPAAIAWWWMAVPFMVLLTGSNAFFFWQWKKAEQQVSSLEIRRDTVFHTRVVYTSDTIYRTRVLRESGRIVPSIYPETQSGIWRKSLEGTGPGLGGILDAQTILNRGIFPIAQNQPIEQVIANDQKEEPKETILPETADRQPNVQKIVSLPPNDIHPVIYSRTPCNLTDAVVLIPASQRRKSFLDHLNTARPKAYQLGISGGLAYPFGSGVDFKSGYAAGIHTALEFSPSLRLWANAAYGKTHFLTDRMGDDIGVPIEGPPSNEYLFLQAEVPQPFFQYSAGMQYLFRTRHRLKPFLGIGLGAISLLPYDVTYEFQNTALGIEWNLDKTVHRQGLISNFMVLPFGLEYCFSRHWNGQFQATYRYNWKGTGVQSPDMLGIQAGLNYRF